MPNSKIIGALWHVVFQMTLNRGSDETSGWNCSGWSSEGNQMSKGTALKRDLTADTSDQSLEKILIIDNHVTLKFKSERNQQIVKSFPWYIHIKQDWGLWSFAWNIKGTYFNKSTKIFDKITSYDVIMDCLYHFLPLKHQKHFDLKKYNY